LFVFFTVYHYPKHPNIPISRQKITKKQKEALKSK